MELRIRRTRFVPRYLAAVATLSCCLAACTQVPSEPLLPPSFQQVQPDDVPVPPTFLLVGTPYVHQVGSFRAALAAYRGSLSPADAQARMRELLGVHGWALRSESPIPGRTDGRLLEFQRQQQSLTVQVYRNVDHTSLEVEIRTLSELAGT